MKFYWNYDKKMVRKTFNKIRKEVFDDCITGGWSNGNCCNDPAYNIYNGVVQLSPIITSNINHF